MASVFTIVFGVFGLLLGSFGNVLILRLPKGQSIRGRSHCMHCKKPIAWYDLLPVASFIILSGKCRACGHKISWQYPCVELVSMAIFLFALAIHPANLASAAAAGIILWALLIASVIDIKSQQVPDLTSIMIAITGLIASAWANQAISAFIGAAIGLGWFGVQWLASRGRWVGSGDILLAAALGFWLGPVGTIAMLMCSYMLGAVAAVTILMKFGTSARKARMPFVPFLACGALLAHLGIASVYLRWMGL